MEHNLPFMADFCSTFVGIYIVDGSKPKEMDASLFPIPCAVCFVFIACPVPLFPRLDRG